MSMTQTLAPHLPYLRRYARALTDRRDRETPCPGGFAGPFDRG